MISEWNPWPGAPTDPRPDDGQRVWVWKNGTNYHGIASFDSFGQCFFIGVNDVTRNVTHWAPCEPPEGP